MLRILSFVIIACVLISHSLGADLEWKEIYRTKERIRKLYSQNKNNPQKILSEEDKTLMLGAYWKYLISPKISIMHYQKKEYRKSEFIGLITGLSSYEFPHWWEDSLIVDDLVSFADDSQIRLTKQSNQFFLKMDSKQLTDTLEKFNLPDFRVMVELRKVIQLKDRNDREFTVDNRHGILREMIVCAHKDHCFVLFPGELYGPYQQGPLLLAFRQNGTYLWQQSLWGAPSDIGFSGWAPPPRIDMAVSGDQLLIYGSGVNGTFVESVSTEDGTVQFRFSPMNLVKDED